MKKLTYIALICGVICYNCNVEISLSIKDKTKSTKQVSADSIIVKQNVLNEKD